MVQQKIVTLADVTQGKLTITRAGTLLVVERRYEFIDGLGAPVPNVAGGRIVEEIEISTIPPDIISALTTIDDWTYNKALVKEGMNDP